MVGCPMDGGFVNKDDVFKNIIMSKESRALGFRSIRRWNDFPHAVYAFLVMHKNNVAWAADLVSCNCLFRCICTARGIRNREEEFEIERKIVPIVNITIILLPHKFLFFFEKKKWTEFFLIKKILISYLKGRNVEFFSLTKMKICGEHNSLVAQTHPRRGS